MAAKCQKDWVSPHKVSLLILVKYISSRSAAEEYENYADCLTICRDKLSLLLLEFFEVSVLRCNLLLSLIGSQP